MSTPTKKDVLKALINSKEEEIRISEIDLKNWEEAADLDEDDVIEPEDLSHQAESTEQKMKVEARLREKKAALKHLHQIDPDDKSNSAMIDTVVKTKDKLFFIGVSSPAIIMGKYSIQGISIEAPIARRIIGLKEGDSFEFNGELVPIESIF